MIGGLALRDTFSYSMMVGGGIGLTFLFAPLILQKKKEACELMVRMLFMFLYDDLIYKRWTEF